MEDKIHEIEQLLADGQLEEVLVRVSPMLTGGSPSQKARLHLVAGKVYYRQQRWGDAINEFSAVLEIDPSHAEAASGIEMAQQILGFFHPDLFNP